MQPNLELRCLLERDEPDSWFAICLDLNVYARAQTRREARERLLEEILCYLQEAYAVDRSHFSDLVPRRAPLPFWVKYYVAKTLKPLLGSRSVRRGSGFRERVPLMPAHGC